MDIKNLHEIGLQIKKYFEKFINHLSVNFIYKHIKYIVKVYIIMISFYLN